jgi:hypothetical protein
MNIGFRMMEFLNGIADNVTNQSIRRIKYNPFTDSSIFLSIFSVTDIKEKLEAIK